MKIKPLYGPIFKLAPDGDAAGGGAPKDSDGERKEQRVDYTDVSKEFKDFNAKYSAKGRAPVEEGGDPNSETNRKVIEQRTAEEDAHAKRREGESEMGAKLAEERAKDHRGPGSNVPKILEDKRNAEKKAMELEAKVKEYDTKVADYETKIGDLQKRIDSGELSSSKVQEYEAKISKMETDLAKDKESLVNENSTLKRKLSAYDLAEDPEFAERFINPVIQSHAVATSVLGDNEQNLQGLHKALLANAAALSASTPQEKQRAENERDAILSDIAGGLSSFASNRFTSAMNEYISLSEKHKTALRNHEQTAQQIREDMKKEGDRRSAEFVATWGRTYEAIESTYEEDTTLSKEDIAKAKDLGLADPLQELEKYSTVAKKTIRGQSQMMEAVDLIHRGRAFAAVATKLKVRDAQLKDAMKLIEKLQGGGTRGGDSSGSDNSSSGDKQTRADFHKRFSANRPDLKTEGSRA